MAFKVRNRNAVKEFKDSFKEEWKNLRFKEWKKYQYQTVPQYKPKKGMVIRDFKTEIEADKFAQQKRKEGYNAIVNMELAWFAGVMCGKPQGNFVVYYSKSKLDLEPHKGFGDFEWVKSSTLHDEPYCAPKLWTGGKR